MDLETRVAALEQKLNDLQRARIHQSDIPAGTIKQIHVGEGVVFIRSGLDAAKPTAATAEQTRTGTPLYFATDTNKLYIYNGTAWKSVTLT